MKNLARKNANIQKIAEKVLAEQSKMLEFAGALLDSRSPKSRKAARAFLKKRGLKRTA